MKGWRRREEDGVNKKILDRNVRKKSEEYYQELSIFVDPSDSDSGAGRETCNVIIRKNL